MATIADYLAPTNITNDGQLPPLKVDGEAHRFCEFDFPNDLEVGNRCILLFTLHPSDDVSNLRFVITAGYSDIKSKRHPTDVWDFTFNTNILHTLHELIPPNTFKIGPDVSDKWVRFAVISGGGSVKLLNVILYFKRNLPI